MKVSYKVLFAVILATAGTNAFGAAAAMTGLATTNYVKGAIESLNGTVTGTTGVVKTISQTDGKITAERGLIGDTDINAISQSKITGLSTALNAKQTTANLVQATDGTIPTADADSTTKYPSMKAAYTIAGKVAEDKLKDTATDVTKLKSDVAALDQKIDGVHDALESEIEGLQDLIGTESVSSQIDAKIGELDGKTTGTGTVVKGVSQADGVVTATLGSIVSADITDGTIAAVDLATDAVETAKIKDLNVTTAKLANTAVTAAKLASNAVETAKIKDANVTAAKLAADAVETAKIKDGNVTGKKIASDAITGAGTVSVSQDATTGVITVTGAEYSLPNANGTTVGGVKTGGDITATDGVLTITDSKVTAAKLASNAVETAKIKDGNVTTAKIADDAVTTAKIKGYDNSNATAKECADGQCALVDLGSGAQWLAIVNEYSAN